MFVSGKFMAVEANLKKITDTDNAMVKPIKILTEYIDRRHKTRQKCKTE